VYIVSIYQFDTPALRRVTCGGEAKGGRGISKLYDTIGATYTVTWRTEPRIAAQVWAALGDAQTALCVDADLGGRLLVAGADAVDFTTAADVAAENAERR
jgi:hypothetical protein